MTIYLAAMVGEILAEELAKIADQYALIAIIFVVCLMILGLIIRGIKALLRAIFRR